MHSTLEAIELVSKFADAKSPSGSYVYFKKGFVFAQSSGAGMILPVDLNLKCAVNCDLLKKALKSLDGKDDLNWTHSKTGLRISAGSTSVDIPAVLIDPPKWFAPPKGGKWIEVSSMVSVHRVLWSADKTHMRGLNAVLLTPQGIAATNGHALSVVGDTDFSKALGLSSAGIGVLSPVFETLSPLDVHLQVHEDRCFITSDPASEGYRVGRLSDRSPPNLLDLLTPAYIGPKMIVDKSALADMVKRAKYGANTALLTFDSDTVQLATDVNADVNFRDAIPLNSSDLQYESHVTLDLRLLASVLDSSLDDTVTVCLRGADMPVGFESGSYRCLLMPLLVGGF